MDINKNTISFPFSESDMALRATYNVDGNLEYLGRARPGAAESAAEWQISKTAYDASGRVTSVKFAAGTNAYTKVWNDRATYSY